MEPALTVDEALAALWSLAALPPQALSRLDLTGHDPVFPSSFAVGAAAQATIAASALAACELAHARGARRRRVGVAMADATAECSGWFSVDGKQPEVWDALAGLYRCADGHVRLHTNFVHHRDGALRVLRLAPTSANRDDVQQALLSWSATDFEQAAADAGAVATALRRFDDWDRTPQGRAIAAQPLMTITRIGDAPALALPPMTSEQPPLNGVRVLDLTRILAGPVCGRALAALGADVMLVNSPKLPNIPSIAETSRGKRSAQVDLSRAMGRQTLWQLIDHAQVFSQGYRPGALAALGFSAQALAERKPGIVVVSLSAYGTEGPWSARRGFDSLVQTAMGYNDAEGRAAADGKPRALPMQILDQASGFLMAFGAAAALWRQQREGGSWHVQVSLAQTGHWLRAFARVEGGLDAKPASIADRLDTETSGFGLLRAVRPSVHLDGERLRHARPSMPPGSDAPRWD